jgi:integration host factor subunit alpha
MTKTVTKADLVDAVHQRVGFSKKESLELVERVFETIKRTLSSGETVKLTGFGRFEVRRKNERRGRNPETEEDLTIPAHNVIAFKPSQHLKAAVAGDVVTQILGDDDGDANDNDDNDEAADA